MIRHGVTSDVVLETKALGLEAPRGQKHKSWSWSWDKRLGLDLGLDKKVLNIFKPFSSLLMTKKSRHCCLSACHHLHVQHSVRQYTVIDQVQVAKFTYFIRFWTEVNYVFSHWVLFVGPHRARMSVQLLCDLMHTKCNWTCWSLHRQWTQRTDR